MKTQKEYLIKEKEKWRNDIEEERKSKESQLRKREKRTQRGGKGK